MIHTMLAALLPLLVALAGIASMHAGDVPADLLVNGEFSAVGDGGIPQGWDHRTKGKGHIRVTPDPDQPFVTVGVDQAGEDSIIQQIITMPPEVVAVGISCLVRWQDIKPGEKGFQKGAIQGRWIVDGKETGAWIDVVTMTGTAEAWSERSKRSSVPKTTDGPARLMLRISLYGVQSGSLDVARMRVTPTTKEQRDAALAANRPAEAYGEAVSDARFARLAKGINLSHWMAQVYNVSPGGKKGSYSDEHFAAWITATDLAFLKKAGFTHVRLSIEPTSLGKAGTLDAGTLARVDKAIAMLLEHGLAVVVDPHPQRTMGKLADDPALQDAFVAWWTALGTHLANTDPERVFLELLNEPGGKGFFGGRWSAFQDRLIMAIRAVAPQHTLIGCPGGFQIPRDFPNLVAHPDRNVVYACHFYEPSQFSHQGAVWMRDWYHPLRDVQWPFNAENLPAIINAISPKDPVKAASAKRAMTRAVEEGVGTEAYIEQALGSVAEWAKAQQRRIVVGEFGVIRPAILTPSALRYLAFVRTAMEAKGMGWCLWDYAGSFALMDNGDSSKRSPAPGVLKALGLDETATP